MKYFIAVLASTFVLPAYAEFPESFEATFIVSDSPNIDVPMHVDDISPTFQFIPGEIFGSPIEDVVLPISKGDNSMLSAPLADWQELASAASAPLSERFLELGLRAEPVNTKLTRMATYAYDEVHDAEIGGYLDELGKDHLLILIYVDRPCTITGEITFRGQKYDHKIELSRPGFHYLSADQEGSIRETIVSGKVLFVITH